MPDNQTAKTLDALTPDDLIDAFAIHAGNVMNDQSSATQQGRSERKMTQFRAAIHRHVQEAIEREREEIAVLAENTYCGHYLESDGDTSLKYFAKTVRARSTTPLPEGT